ncbi:MAG: hypothetical protein ACRDO7_05125 [Nocardioidaceae bacterium]
MSTSAEMTYPSTTGTATRPVPRWAVIAAHVAAFAPVLSSLWRLPLIFGVSMGMTDAFMDDMMSHPFAARAGYLVGLGVVSDALAFLTIGLVRPWGDAVPRRMPVLGGRRIPPAAVIIPAVVGGLAATAVFVPMVWLWPENITELTGWTALMTFCYAPLMLWGPLVLAVTWAYYRRRCR